MAAKGKKKSLPRTVDSHVPPVPTSLPHGIPSVNDIAVTITVEMAKEFLGWEEDPTKVKKGWLFDDHGKRSAGLGKVWCTKNTSNRPLDLGHCYKIAQDILMRRYKLNGESIIIGESGLEGELGQLISAQHRLIALVIADTLRLKNPARWESLWPEPCTIRSVVIGGVSTDKETVRTVDNVRPRTLGDVIFTEHSVFAGESPSHRAAMCRSVEGAVKCLWARTDAGTDDVRYMTHSEAVDFIDRHPKLLEAVKHVWDEDDDKAIAKYCPPGYASGLLYLFAASATTPDDYLGAEPADRVEDSLDFFMWDQACEFFTLLAKGEEFGPVREAVGALFDEDTGSGGRLSEKAAILVKAWNRWVEGDEELVDDPPLILTTRDDITKLAEWPVCGGVDTPKHREPDEPDSTQEPGGDTPQSVKAKKLSGAVLMTQFTELKRQHPGKVLVFDGGNRYYAWADDAELFMEEFATAYDRPKEEWGEVKRSSFPAVDLDMNLAQLFRLGKGVSLVTGELGGTVTVRELTAPASVTGKKPGVTPVRPAAVVPPVKPAPEVVLKPKAKPALRGGTN